MRKTGEKGGDAWRGVCLNSMEAKYLLSVMGIEEENAEARRGLGLFLEHAKENGFIEEMKKALSVLGEMEREVICLERRSALIEEKCGGRRQK